MRRGIPAALAGFAVVPLLAGCMLRAPVPAASPPADLPAGAGTAPAPPAAPSRVAARLQPRAGHSMGTAPQCLAEIEAFAQLHSGNRVILGQAAFADSDELVLVRMPRRGADGLRLDGRAAPPQPVVLKLLAGPDGCFVQLADAPSAEAALPACECTPLAR